MAHDVERFACLVGRRRAFSLRTEKVSDLGHSRIQNARRFFVVSVSELSSQLACQEQ
jgi:hypothetical protein